MISGRDLNVDWDGAQVSGGFGLIAGQQSGQFGLDIAFADVDAISRPLSQWLPMKAFEPKLREWLENDIGGLVPQGSLKLSQPLGPAASSDQLSATLALEVTQATCRLRRSGRVWKMSRGACCGKEECFKPR